MRDGRVGALSYFNIRQAGFAGANSYLCSWYGVQKSLKVAFCLL